MSSVQMAEMAVLRELFAAILERMQRYGVPPPFVQHRCLSRLGNEHDDFGRGQLVLRRIWHSARGMFVRTEFRFLKSGIDSVQWRPRSQQMENASLLEFSRRTR